MYIADQVKLPGWTVPGEVTFFTSPMANTFPADLRDTMNWEASGHATNFGSFFYVWVPAANLSQSQLQSFIETDITDSGVPPVVNVNDNVLPSWQGSRFAGQAGHSVAIVGYNNAANTYTYIETCTRESCGTQRTGAFTISQNALYTGIQTDPQSGDGGIVW